MAMEAVGTARDLADFQPMRREDPPSNESRAEEVDTKAGSRGYCSSEMRSDQNIWRER
jgi:hypothetical protein